MILSRGKMRVYRHGYRFSNRFLSTKSDIDITMRSRHLKKYIDSSPDPYHCVQTSISMLEKYGFKRILEESSWGVRNKVQPGGKYFFTRNMSSIVAFGVGERYADGSGFKIIGAHTDSPNLRVKPNPDATSCGSHQLNVACYGGGLWHTWLDRDLSLCGKAMVRRRGTDRITHRLFRVNEPVLRIPSLCIHLSSTEEREALKLNKETHLKPMICSVAASTLAGGLMAGDDKESALLALIGNHIGYDSDEIMSYDLSLFDTQGAVVTDYGGCIYSSRLDNQASCYAALEALCAHTSSQSFHQDEQVSMVALFDHEEVGSGSSVGAGSTLMADALERVHHALCVAPDCHDQLKIAQRRSFIISADMAHAVHPNYASKHDKSHSPRLGGGLVIKHNANQRYATTGETSFILEEIARLCGVPTQSFSVKNDCPCGSTIGPIISASTGIRAADIGMPQLSMHSIREMMACVDLTHAFHHFVTFFDKFALVDGMIVKVDHPDTK